MFDSRQAVGTWQLLHTKTAQVSSTVFSKRIPFKAAAARLRLQFEALSSKSVSFLKGYMNHKTGAMYHILLIS